MASSEMMKSLATCCALLCLLVHVSTGFIFPHQQIYRRSPSDARFRENSRQFSAIPSPAREPSIGNSLNDLWEALKEKNLEGFQKQREALTQKRIGYFIPDIRKSVETFSDEEIKSVFDGSVQLGLQHSNMSHKLLLDPLLYRHLRVNSTSIPTFMTLLERMVLLGFRWNSLEADLQRQFISFLERSIPHMMQEASSLLKLVDLLVEFQMNWNALDKSLQYQVLLKFYGLRDFLSERETIYFFHQLHKLNVNVKWQKMKIWSVHLQAVQRLLPFVLEPAEEGESREELIFPLLESFLFSGYRKRHFSPELRGNITAAVERCWDSLDAAQMATLVYGLGKNIFLFQELPESLRRRLLERVHAARDQLADRHLLHLLLRGWKFMALDWYRYPRIREMVFELCTRVFSPEQLAETLRDPREVGHLLLTLSGVVDLPAHMKPMLLGVMEKVLPSIWGTNYNMVFCSLGNLQVPWASLSASLRDGLFQAVLASANQSHTEAIANIVFGLSQTGLQWAEVPASVRKVLLVGLEKQQDEIHASQLGLLLFGFGRMGFRWKDFSHELRTIFTKIFTRNRTSLQMPDLHTILYGLGLSGVVFQELPGDAQAALLKAFPRYVPRLKPVLLGLYFYSLGRMQTRWFYDMHYRILDVFLDAFTRLAADLQLRDLARIVRGLGGGSLPYEDLPAHVVQTMNHSLVTVAARPDLGPTAPHDLAVLLDGLAGMRASWDMLNVSMSDALEAIAERSLKSAGWRDLSRCMSALACVTFDSRAFKVVRSEATGEFLSLYEGPTADSCSLAELRRQRAVFSVYRMAVDRFFDLLERSGGVLEATAETYANFALFFEFLEVLPARLRDGFLKFRPIPRLFAQPTAPAPVLSPTRIFGSPEYSLALERQQMLDKVHVDLAKLYAPFHDGLEVLADQSALKTNILPVEVTVKTRGRLVAFVERLRDDDSTWRRKELKKLIYHYNFPQTPFLLARGKLIRRAVWEKALIENMPARVFGKDVTQRLRRAVLEDIDYFEDGAEPRNEVAEDEQRLYRSELSSSLPPPTVQLDSSSPAAP